MARVYTTGAVEKEVSETVDGIDRLRTKLSENQEADFQTWYKAFASKFYIDQNPDHPAHHYDYRGAYKAGMGPNKEGHWPSQFKDDDHPNRFIKREDPKTGKQRWYDTKYDNWVKNPVAE